MPQLLFDSLKETNALWAFPVVMILLSILVPVIQKLGFIVEFKKVTSRVSFFINLTLHPKTKSNHKNHK